MTTTRRRSAPKRWRISVGGYGHRVTACERNTSEILYLRWWNGERDNWQWESLGHRDRAMAEHQARQLAASILAATDADARGQLTVADLFARFEEQHGRHLVARQRREDRRRMRVWTGFLAGTMPVSALDRPTFDRFVRGSAVRNPARARRHPGRAPDGAHHRG